MAHKEQRRINRWVRQFNKDLAADDFLDLKRFEVRQVKRDGRDWDTTYSFVVNDTKTGNRIFVWHLNAYNFREKLFWATNDFVVTARIKEKW